MSECDCGAYDCDVHSTMTIPNRTPRTPPCLCVLEAGFTPMKSGRIYLTSSLCARSPLAEPPQSPFGSPRYWGSRLEAPTREVAIAHVLRTWEEKEVCPDCELIRQIAMLNGFGPLTGVSDVKALFELIGEM